MSLSEGGQHNIALSGGLWRETEGPCLRNEIADLPKPIFAVHGDLIPPKCFQRQGTRNLEIYLATKSRNLPS